jgi:hypothetical protein
MGTLMWKSHDSCQPLQPNRNIFAASPRPDGAADCLLTAADVARAFCVVSGLGEVADLALPATSGSSRPSMPRNRFAAFASNKAGRGRA